MLGKPGRSLLALSSMPTSAVASAREILTGLHDVMARHFASEMGDFAERLEEFALHWSTSAAIAACFDEFREETRGIFAALETRIRRENRQLYPLADRLAGPPARSAA